MPKVIPFKACRPTRDKAGLVGSRSFIEYSESDLNDKLLNNPFTYLHVIYPDFGTPGYKEKMGLDRFKRVREKFQDFVSANILKRDEKASFYIYRQVKASHSFTGIIAGVSAQDYKEGKVKIHEHTITAREEMFKNYLKETAINAEPVLLAHPDNKAIDTIIEQVTTTRADFEFTTTDQITHYLWPIENDELIKQIQTAYSSLSAFYIADGHHRSASSCLLANDLPDNENAQYFMCYLLAESQMQILPFHRFVKDLNGLSEEEFLAKLKVSLNIESTLAPVAPSNVHEFGMYLNQQWYRIIPKANSYNEDHPVEHLDCSILNNLVLTPILGIEDAKTDTRIAYQGGEIDLQMVEQLVNSGRYEIGFTLFPVTMKQLKQVADTNNFMPPKSTWVEPKLRSGLVIYEF